MLFYDDLYEDFMKKLANIDENSKNSEISTFRCLYDLDTALGGQNRYSIESLDWIIGPDGKIIKFIYGTIPYTHIVFSCDEHSSDYTYKYAYCYYDRIVALGTEEGRCGGLTYTYTDDGFLNAICKMQSGDNDERKLYEKIKKYNIKKRKINLSSGHTIEYKEIKRHKEWIELLINHDPNSDEFNLFINKDGEYKFIKSGTLEELKNSAEWNI